MRSRCPAAPARRSALDQASSAPPPPPPPCCRRRNVDACIYASSKTGVRELVDGRVRDARVSKTSQVGGKTTRRGPVRAALESAVPQWPRLQQAQSLIFAHVTLCCIGSCGQCRRGSAAYKLTFSPCPHGLPPRTRTARLPRQSRDSTVHTRPPPRRAQCSAPSLSSPPRSSLPRHLRRRRRWPKVPTCVRSRQPTTRSPTLRSVSEAPMLPRLRTGPHFRTLRFCTGWCERRKRRAGPTASSHVSRAGRGTRLFGATSTGAA
jgi:hypothetical protein